MSDDAITSDAKALAVRLNQLKPDERLRILGVLHFGTYFCWDCGFDFHNGQRICHCMNDE